MPIHELKGWHVGMIFASFFGVIIAVNLVLAVNAVRSFPGLEVKNSYIASQSFDVRREQQKALGWEVALHGDEREITLSILDQAGQPVQVAHLGATLGRATHIQQDQSPNFAFNGRNYVADVHLDSGYWNLRLKARALDGTQFEQRLPLVIRP